MDFKDLLDLYKSEAINNTISVNEISVWRSICRSYSKKFSTPLHLCLDGTIPMEDILLAEFEEQLSDFDADKDLEAMLDQIYALEDPEYEKSKQDELEEFMEKAERDEEKRIKLGKPIHKEMKQETSLPAAPPKNLPKSGGINLSYLSKEEEG